MNVDYLLKFVRQLVDLQDEILKRMLGGSLQEQVQLFFGGRRTTVEDLKRLRNTTVEAYDDSNETILSVAGTEV